MDKKLLIELTNKLYCLTLLFPKKEPLRYKIRELAVEILVDWEKGNPGFLRLKEKIETLNLLFEVAENQNWIPNSEIFQLKQEYYKLREGLEIKEFNKKIQEKDAEKTERTERKDADIGCPQAVPEREDRSLSALNERQKRILEILKEKERIQVRQLKEALPNVTKRTLRRDSNILLKQGFIERIGEKNETYYKIKGQ